MSLQIDAQTLYYSRLNISLMPPSLLMIALELFHAFDRITRPEQLLLSLPKAMSVLTDPADCGPVTLSLCQDVQAESYHYPSSFLNHVFGRCAARPDEQE